MTLRRTPPRFLRRALGALAVACALAGPASAADPPPSRPYPPTYSSRKAPWYDPFKWFSDSDKKTVVPASAVALAAAAPQPTKPVPKAAPVPNAAVEPKPGSPDAKPGSPDAPAWKWYGYGTPTPGRNPLAPAGRYATVPGNWYTSSGATPGAVPLARIGPTLPGLVPDPFPDPRLRRQESTFAAPDDGPTLAPIVRQPAERFAEVDWSPAPPATLLPPTADQTANQDPAPPATLRAPVRADEVPVAAPTLGPPTGATETPAASSPPAESPDIPVEPAKDVIVPPTGGTMSRADRPITARGRAPEPNATDLIRQACGPNVRVMEVAPVGPKQAIVRLAATREAALAARDRLAQVPELAGWRIDFDLVTPLRP